MKTENPKDKYVSTTFYIPKSEFLRINNIRSFILKEYGIKLPLSYFYRTAVTEYLNKHFREDQEMFISVNKYLNPINLKNRRILKEVV